MSGIAIQLDSRHVKVNRRTRVQHSSNRIELWVKSHYGMLRDLHQERGDNKMCNKKNYEKNICCGNVHVLFAKLRMPFGS